MTFVVKDSGEREQFDSGMVRDTEAGKTDYTLVLDGPMFERWAAHLTKGAEKYEARNWMKAAGDAEYDRFVRSAFRHFMQWVRGDQDEDHAAAVIFNINGAEYVADQIEWAELAAEELAEWEQTLVDGLNDEYGWRDAPEVDPHDEPAPKWEFDCQTEGCPCTAGDVGPPAPGEGDELPNPEIGLEC